jgi:hypothetical protein
MPGNWLLIRVVRNKQAGPLRRPNPAATSTSIKA